MTVTSSLVPVQFYVPTDSYYYSVSNRPLVDIATNISTIMNFLQEMQEGCEVDFYTDTGSTNALQLTAPELTGDIPPGLVVAVLVADSNTGPVTLSIVDGPTLPVASVLGGLQGGELTGGTWALLSWQGTEWLLLGSEVGSKPLSTGQQAQPVLLGQIQDGMFLLSLTSVTGTTLSTGTLAVSGLTSVEGGTSGNELINYGQLVDGLGYQASVIDWSGVTQDTPLGIGQTAFYSVQEANSVPLHIACSSGTGADPGQLYEVTLVHGYPASGIVTGTGMDLDFFPNNTSYSQTFYYSQIESCNTNQANSVYEAASSTAQFGLYTPAASQMNNFYADDVAGQTNPPYMRRFQLYTGTILTGTAASSGQAGYNAAAAFNSAAFNTVYTPYQGAGSLGNPCPKLMVHIGGGGSDPSSTPGDDIAWNGNNLSMCLWNNTSTNWTSLGTLQCNSALVTWTIFVTRIF